MLKEKRFRLPAEWEPQAGVQLTWPHAGTDWAPMLDEVTTTYRSMARAISQRERLLVVAPEGSAPGLLHVNCPTDDTWARDHGFITLVAGDEETEGADGCQRHCRLLDFRFNGWGEKFPAAQDNAINRRLYALGVVSGEYCDRQDFVLEGGAIESDGQGTVMTTTRCQLAAHRNQPLTKSEIEARLMEDLCADRVIWIDHGQLKGDDTDGHIDTLVRFAPDDTLLYIRCDDCHDEHYEELQLMEEQLRGLRTADGRPYRLLGLPLPKAIYDEQGERLPATHANFLVINGAVLCPTYDQPESDAEALATIGRAFPGREVVGIDCRSLIKQHGSLHCCTMQFPKGAMG